MPAWSARHFTRQRAEIAIRSLNSRRTCKSLNGGPAGPRLLPMPDSPFGSLCPSCRGGSPEPFRSTAGARRPFGSSPMASPTSEARRSPKPAPLRMRESEFPTGFLAKNFAYVSGPDSRCLAGVEGLEPPTPGFGDRCSSRLSYTPPRPARRQGLLPYLHRGCKPQHARLRLDLDRTIPEPRFDPSRRVRP